MTYILRYRPDTSLGQRFSTIRYPWRGPGYPTREQAEEIRAMCVNAADIEVVEHDEREG